METLLTSKTSTALAGEVKDFMIKYNLTFDQAVKLVHLNHNLPGTWERLFISINHFAENDYLHN